MIKILGYKAMQVILSISRDLFKDQITDILIFRLTFASDFKTIPFCELCVFMKDRNNSLEKF